MKEVLLAGHTGHEPILTCIYTSNEVKQLTWTKSCDNIQYNISYISLNSAPDDKRDNKQTSGSSCTEEAFTEGRTSFSIRVGTRSIKTQLFVIQEGAVGVVFTLQTKC